jgi:hypothetical protein
MADRVSSVRIGLDGPDDPAEALDSAHAAALNRLRAYLAARHPDAVEAFAARGGSDPVTLACDLMDRLPLMPGTQISPCSVTDCNKAAGHIDPHGPAH